MPVRILSGRTRRLLPRVVAEIGAAYRAGQRCVLLVPEQFTLQAELELVERLQLPGFFDLDVLSPTRLIQRVFERAGSPPQVRIDARGKHMVLRCVLEDLQGELTFYRRAASRAGFVDKLAALIADVKRSGLTPEGLSAAAQALPEGALAAKLADVALVYAEYERRLAGRFVDGEDVENAMRDRLAASEIFAGAQVWVYGFDMITQQFAGTLAAIAGLAEALCVALVMDAPPSRDAALYAPVRQSAQRFTRLLDERGIAHVTDQETAPLAANETLQWLERELYAYPAEKLHALPQGLTLSAAATPYAEAQLAAARILAWVRDGGYTWSDIAVQYPAADPYAGLLRHVFAQYGIPAYIDEKRPAAQHPLIQGLLAALRCATQGWRPEDALAYLKSGFAGLTEEEGFRLERYAIEHGLRGSRWKKPLYGAERYAELRAEIEPLRARLAEPLAALQAALREAKNADGTLRAIVAFLQDIRAFEALEQYRQALLGAGLPTEAAHTGQVWQHLLRTLDQMHALLDGHRAPAALVLDMLGAGLAAVELGALPPSPDALVCGELGHVRTGQIKALLVLGLTDGALGGDNPGLLSEPEQQQAEEIVGAHLGMAEAARVQLARLDVLQALTQPTERLWLSYPLADARGATQRPAMVVSQIGRVFPQLVVRGGALEEGSLEALGAPRAALEALGPALRAALEGQNLPAPLHAAYATLRQSPLWLEALDNVLAGLHATVQADPVPPPEENKADQRYSITRLETFAACPYQHFVRYRLRPRPFQPYGLHPVEVGEHYHSAIEAYTRAALATPGWPDISRQQSDALMQAALSPLLFDVPDDTPGEAGQARALAARLGATACRAAWTMTQQIQQGQFMPTELEFNFGQGEAAPLPVALPEGGALYLHGRIDRLDTWRQDGQEYLRIVDYKATSQPRRLEATRIYWGLQQQLLIYMAAALKAHPAAQPAGLFYFRIDDPLLETYERDAEKIEQGLLGELKMSGLMLDDPAVVVAQGRADLLTQKGEVRKNASAAPPEGLKALIGHAERKAAELAGRISAGDIAIAPVQIGQWSACTYCDYAAVCGIDPALPGGRLTELPKMKMEALLEMLAHD